jgi:hypothetical protein
VPKCAVCREPATTKYALTYACSIEHAREAGQAKAKAKREREARKELRLAKRAIKTRAQWMKEAQAAFNAWVRARDADQPCISCDRYHEGKYDAGHYRSTGSNPALRFEPANCHKQCVPCNQHKSGNAIEYRAHLVNRIGFERLQWLEGPHDPKKYTIEELQEIKQRYTRMRKELEKERI